MRSIEIRGIALRLCRLARISSIRTTLKSFYEIYYYLRVYFYFFITIRLLFFNNKMFFYKSFFSCCFFHLIYLRYDILEVVYIDKILSKISQLFNKSVFIKFFYSNIHFFYQNSYNKQIFCNIV